MANRDDNLILQKHHRVADWAPPEAFRRQTENLLHIKKTLSQSKSDKIFIR